MIPRSGSDADSESSAGQPAKAPLPEIVMVLGVPTVFFLLATFILESLGVSQAAFTDARLLRTLVAETALSALLLPLLRRRAWTPYAVAGPPQPLDVLRGTLVWLGCYAATYVALVIQI